MHDNLEICREHKDNLGNVFHARVRGEKSWPEKGAYGGRSGVPTEKAAAMTICEVFFVICSDQLLGAGEKGGMFW